MQSKTLLKKTSCPEPTFKDWLRKGVILPARPGRGAGNHAEYDDANAVALLIGVKMKQAAITVASYAPAFAALQMWLRNTSSLEWPKHTVVMTLETASVHPAKKSFDLVEMAIVVPLAPVCAALLGNVAEPDYYQHSLLGLQAVRRAK